MIKWDILIATLCTRTEQLEELLRCLMPQVDAANGQVHVTAFRNLGEPPLATVRQELVEAATGEYVSFIDDDDRVPDDFVSTILPLMDGVDTINWRMQVYFDGIPQKPTYHGLSFAGWSEDAQGYYRDVSHLNPMRAELAKKCDFRRSEPPEDWAWVQQMQRLVRTEHVISYDRIMYHYFHTTGSATWRPGTVSTSYDNITKLSLPDSPNFSLHLESAC